MVRKDSRLVRAALVVVASLTTVLLTEGGVAYADQGIDIIGPGPSINDAGVRCIQSALHISTDGQFGDETYQAVKTFQKGNGLSVDGAVGPDTGERIALLAPDGCFHHLPTTSAEQDWVPTPRPGLPVGDTGGADSYSPGEATYFCAIKSASSLIKQTVIKKLLHGSIPSPLEVGQEILSKNPIGAGAGLAACIILAAPSGSSTAN